MNWASADNTILIFTSDNGPAFGTWNGFSQSRFNYGLNGSKGNTYEGGIRVPLIMRWPAGLDGGVRSDEMAHFADWFPTLLNLVGVDIPDDLALDGIDVTPALRGGRRRRLSAAFLAMESLYARSALVTPPCATATGNCCAR